MTFRVKVIPLTLAQFIDIEQLPVAYEFQCEPDQYIFVIPLLIKLQIHSYALV